MGTVNGMTTLHFYCGSNGGGREECVDELVRAHSPRSVLIVPGRAQAQSRRESLILNGAMPGGWGRVVYAFDDFAAHLLSGDGLRVNRIDDLDRRLVLEQCLDQLEEQGRLGPFSEARRQPGVVTHLLHVLSKLKQAAVEPLTFVKRIAGEPGPFDTAVADIYQAYQETLIRERQHDVPGLYWEADVLARQGCPKALGGVTLLGFDGFDDFTPSEFRLLEALCKHVETAVIGLNYDMGPGRKDLYTLPSETAERIRNCFDTPPQCIESKHAVRYSEFAAQNLFWRDQPVLPPGLRANLEILPCSDLLHEVETIGRRVKSLVMDHGCPADSIAVLFRNFSGVAPLLRTVFGEFGIPVRLQYRLPVEKSLYGTLLTRLFGMLQTWEREEVLEVLLSPPLVVKGCSEAFPLLSRQAGIVRGYGQWMDRLEHLLTRVEAGHGKDIEALLRRLPNAVECLRALLYLIGELAEWAGQWPCEATQTDFACSVDELLLSWKAEQHIEELDALSAVEEGAALRALRGLLGRLGAASTSQRRISRAIFLERLAEGMRSTAVPCPDSGSGVFCADAPSVRQLQFRHVFFGGLIEGQMPVPPAVNAVYSERELERLRKCGIDLEGVREHIARERLLFHHVITSAQEGLTLSWHLSKSGGRPSAPSPMLTELKRVFPEDVVIEAPEPVAQSFLPGVGSAASERDVRNVLFRFESTERQRFQSVFQGETLEKARAGDAPFDVFSGVLSGTPDAEVIAKRFNAEHEFSVTQLETYLKCPFRFLADRCWQIPEHETPDPQFDPLVRGSILHAALTEFHRAFSGQAVADIADDKANTRMADCVEVAFQQNAWKSTSSPCALVQAELIRMKRVLLRYLAIERRGDEAQWKPSLFEVSFGHPADSEEEADVPRALLEVETPAGPVRFRGRIDRIDQNGSASRIIDYKSGQLPAAKDITEGRSVQLSVYAWAVEHSVSPEASCSEAYFVRVGSKKRQGGLAPGKQDRDARETTARNAIGKAVEKIRAGYFPPVPAATACTYCAYTAACRKRKSSDEEEDADGDGPQSD